LPKSGVELQPDFRRVITHWGSGFLFLHAAPRQGLILSAFLAFSFLTAWIKEERMETISGLNKSQHFPESAKNAFPEQMLLITSCLLLIQFLLHFRWRAYSCIIINLARLQDSSVSLISFCAGIGNDPIGLKIPQVKLVCGMAE
jgi:hypothetical protein